jgi:NAD+ diphosphatase
MQVSSAYRFCPLCGAGRTRFEPSRPFRCDACAYTSFFGPVTAVGAIVTNPSGEVLLIERARDPGKGMLGMPGGFVDPMEDAEVAVRREIYEELGIRVAQLSYLTTASNTYAYQGVIYPVLDIFYHAECLADQAIVAESSEVHQWHWTSLSAAILDRMAFVSNRYALEFYQANGIPSKAHGTKF